MSNEEFAEKVKIAMDVTYKELIAQKRRDNEMLIVGDKKGNVVYLDPFDVEI